MRTPEELEKARRQEAAAVTVVMPAYNCASTLQDAVESVRAQTFKDWRLLIVDDCSRDETRELAQRLAEDDGRIGVLHNEKNLGVGGTRNRGITEADSEWIAFLDSDDMWQADKLEAQMKLAASVPEAKLLFTGSGFMREDRSRMDYVLHVPERIDRKTLLKQNLISCSSVLVKRALLLKYPMPEKAALHEDFAVWLRILGEEAYAWGVDRPLLIYRVSAQSKSGNKRKAAKMNWNTYREVGLGPIRAVYCMLWYTVKGLIKYRHLR